MKNKPILYIILVVIAGMLFFVGWQYIGDRWVLDRPVHSLAHYLFDSLSVILITTIAIAASAIFIRSRKK